MTSDKKISIKTRLLSLMTVVLLLVTDQVIKYFVDLKLKGSPAVVVLKNIV